MEGIDDSDISSQQVLLAAAHHDLEALRSLLKTASANGQDGETGMTPLHAAIAACTHDDKPNGVASYPEEAQAAQQQEMLRDAEKTLKLLFQNGAIWNDLDVNDETPGCLALRLGLRELYEVVVDAGVRAELLMNRLDEYEPLGDGSDEEDEEEEAEDEGEEEDAMVVENGQGSTRPEIIILSPEGDPNGTDGTLVATDESTESANYLASSLSFQEDKLLDASSNGVMMQWEHSIMQRTVSLILPSPALAVLNIGHGMAIFDSLVQATFPSTHHIVEAHPQVLEQMRANGWMEKHNVVVHEGRWQDVLPRLVEQGVQFDAIYFDTFAEDYKAFRYFFNEYVIGLLKTGGIWSFFNGLGADRQVCYDVYTKLVEMDLFEAGFDTEWEVLETPDLEGAGEWEGVRRKYWALKAYRLPTCRFIG